jgi:hypothetical protein
LYPSRFTVCQLTRQYQLWFTVSVKSSNCFCFLFYSLWLLAYIYIFWLKALFNIYIRGLSYTAIFNSFKILISLYGLLGFESIILVITMVSLIICIGHHVWLLIYIRWTFLTVKFSSLLLELKPLWRTKIIWKKKRLQKRPISTVNWITNSKECSDIIEILMEYSTTVINKKIFRKQRKIVRTVDNSLEMVPNNNHL